jgi:FO synthase
MNGLRRAPHRAALITLGDAPEDRCPAAQKWLDANGYDSTLAHVRAVAIGIL